MLMSLIIMLIRLAISCLVLALRMALALAAIAGRLLGTLILGFWRAWRSRKGNKIALRNDEIELGTSPPKLLPPPPAPTAFTPRPMRPRPKR